jgi:hypothetical protein
MAQFNEFSQGDISGSHGGEYEDDCPEMSVNFYPDYTAQHPRRQSSSNFLNFVRL